MQNLPYFFLKKGLVEMKVLSLPFQADENCGLYKQIIGRRKLLLEYEKIQEDGYIIRNYLRMVNGLLSLPIYQMEKHRNQQMVCVTR